MIKALFFDVDNTLYCWKEHRFMPEALKAIKKLQKKGIKVFLCTARPYDSMKRFHCFNLGLEWDGWIGSAGAVAFTDGKFVFKELMDPKDAKGFIRLAKENGLMMEVVTPRSRYVTDERNEYYFEFEKYFEEPWCPVKDYKGGQCTGFLLYSPEKFDPLFLERFPHLAYDRFHEFALDVMPVRHSKGKGIAAVMKYYGWNKDEAMGFGDGEQDIAMKEGLNQFVAMGNALPIVKNAADFVTKNVEEDGVVHALNHFGLLD